MMLNHDESLNLLVHLVYLENASLKISKEMVYRTLELITIILLKME